jgi:ABC-2 type transport system ATP-binding protein
VALTAEPIAQAPSRTRADPEIAVRIQDLTKRFPVRRTLRAIATHPFAREQTTSIQSLTCDIHAGEFFGLLGPNGAGKTTLLKMLATLILPDEGEITVNGHDVVHEPEKVRAQLTPVIANERSLYWRLTARENLELFAALLHVPRPETRQRIDEVLEVVGLADTGTKMVGQFSSGMMQRLLIGRALIARPRVLLLDEPTRSLDPISARTFRAFLREELVDRRGCAVILATHNAEEAFDLCDRVGVLDRGRLLAVGSAEVLARDYARPRYRLWTTAPEHPAVASLANGTTTRSVGQPRPSSDGWSIVDLEITDGLDAAARLLDFLVAAGVPVAKLESSPVTLAELIERVVERQGGGKA